MIDDGLQLKLAYFTKDIHQDKKKKSSTLDNNVQKRQDGFPGGHGFATANTS